MLNQSGKPNVNVLGTSIFTTFLLPFEITSALLVIAIIGAVVLARRPARGSDPETGEGSAHMVADEAAAGGPSAVAPTAGELAAADAAGRAETAAAGEDAGAGEREAVPAGPAGQRSQP